MANSWKYKVVKKGERMENNNKVENKSTKAEKPSQTKDVLKYLQTHEYITDVIAFEKFGANRLSDIIFRLRNKGYTIKTRMVTKKSRYGNSCTYGEYILVE